MTQFEIKPVARSAVKPLVGFYGKSGSGKTMSALLFARGIVGPKGRIVLIDTENRRGSYYADNIPGGYSVMDLDEPFSPDRYREAITAAEAAADCIVVDSMSHEWSGAGGVLESHAEELDRMAGNDWKKRESCNLIAWNRAKAPHQKMVGRLLRSKVALICCLRGKEKTHFKKDANGKNIVVTDEFSSPIADPDFIFEMLNNFETYEIEGQGGYVIPRKIGPPALKAVLPKSGDRITTEHGHLLARWCEGATVGNTPTIQPDADLTALKQELWAKTQSIHFGKKENKMVLQQWLIDEAHIDPDDQLDTLSADRLRDVLARLKARQS